MNTHPRLGANGVGDERLDQREPGQRVVGVAEQEAVPRDSAAGHDCLEQVAAGDGDRFCSFGVPTAESQIAGEVGHPRRRVEGFRRSRWVVGLDLVGDLEELLDDVAR